jgi:3-oxoacyl-[acyl-carrier-protein] synthase II
MTSLDAPLAITGIGAVSGFGIGTAALWAGLSTGSSAIRRFDLISPQSLPVVIAAQAPLHLPAPDTSPSRAASLGWLAAREALDQAQLTNTTPLGFCGAIGWPMEIPLQSEDEPVALHRGGDWLAGALGIESPRRFCLSACAASTQSLGDAARWLRSGRVRQCLVVGADTRLHPLGIIGYDKLGALETRHHSRPSAASRPFDIDRGGFVIGEGAGAVVLETAESARQRGVRPRAWLRGHAATNDAYRLTDPEPEGTAAARCISLALQDGGLGPESVDYLNLHGTGTPANDAAETAALRRAFGTHLARIHAGSFKSMIGHLAMAAGAVEVVGTVLALEHQCVPPNLNLDHPDPACSGPTFTGGEARSASLRFALKGSYGFGGQNAAVLLEKGP